MGKALTQLGETIKEFDDDLFEEQSHAQLGEVVIPDGYSFATRSTNPMSIQLLLDNQSSVHLMCNPNFV